MNPVAWVLDALKVHPEPASLPESLTDSTPIQLAEARSRLGQIAQVATELRKLVDQELAGKIPVGLRYGDQVYRPSNGRGAAKVYDPDGFFSLLATGVERSEDPPALLASLFPASSVRLTALPKLAELLGFTPEGFKDTIIAYDPPSSPLSVMPLAKAPKHLQTLAEGELR